MKKIALLGATGSIGTSTLAVLRAHPDKFKCQLICAHNNIEKLLEIAEEFDVPNIIVTNKIKQTTPSIQTDRNIYYGEAELYRILKDIDVDIVLNAIAGSAGLKSTMTALDRGLDVALANKESLVMAGHLVKDKLSQSSARILPVDSEHSAIFQCIGNIPNDEICKIILTASGGSFRDRDLNTFSSITFKDSLNHPTWSMGTKITIDSATMLNKGLEVIEAHWLFDMPYNQINALIHPQSIIHSMVEFNDGSTLAQMGFPNMQLPILYALSYPKHIQSQIAKTDFLNVGSLSFKSIEKERYPLYYFALEVGKSGGLLPTIMNAANEAAISLFQMSKIGFVDIHPLVEKYVQKTANIDNPDLETIITTNREIYNKIIRDYS